jgi:hypothetical protein
MRMNVRLAVLPFKSDNTMVRRHDLCRQKVICIVQVKSHFLSPIVSISQQA